MGIPGPVKQMAKDPSELRELPKWIKRGFYYYSLKANASYYRKRGNPSGETFMDKDWDVLILLDGCRYDLFKQRTETEDPPSAVSMASDSWGFMQSNFVDKTFHDTVYVSSNPYTASLPSNTFHDVRNLLVSHWDEGNQTVLPEDVVTVAKEAATEYPNKRLLIHFMQPHFPFLGETGKQIDMSMSRSPSDPDETTGLLSPWYLSVFNGVSPELLRKAYEENFDLVWNEVKPLISEIKGKTVVSADHGNLIGERLSPIPIQGWGHPRGIYHKNLIRVPWQVYDGERREIKSDAPAERAEMDEAVVNRRLADLGYV